MTLQSYTYFWLFKALSLDFPLAISSAPTFTRISPRIFTLHVYSKYCVYLYSTCFYVPGILIIGALYSWSVFLTLIITGILIRNDCSFNQSFQKSVRSVSSFWSLIILCFLFLPTGSVWDIPDLIMTFVLIPDQILLFASLWPCREQNPVSNQLTSWILIIIHIPLFLHSVPERIYIMITILERYLIIFHNPPSSHCTSIGVRHVINVYDHIHVFLSCLLFSSRSMYILIF
jgi:hypothetical protein